jgi:hypothetical protein
MYFEHLSFPSSVKDRESHGQDNEALFRAYFPRESEKSVWQSCHDLSWSVGFAAANSAASYWAIRAGPFPRAAVLDLP